MTSKTILALAFEAGIRPFDPVPASAVSSRNVSDVAATLLGDRNLYFRKDYREKFNTRVHSIELSPHRLVMACVESAQPPQGDRRCRTLLFRCDGEVIYHTPDSRVLDLNAANVEMRYEMGKVDEQRILSSLCMQQVRLAARMRDNAEKALAALAKLGASP